MIIQKKLALLVNEGYTEEQVEKYRIGTEYGFNMEPYLDRRYRPGELMQIILGLLSGVDVAIYSECTRFTSSQMYFLRKGMEYGFDVSCIAKPEFEPDQMKSIIYAMRRGIDVSPICDVRIPANQMGLMTHQILKNMEKTEQPTVGSGKRFALGDRNRYSLKSFQFQTVDFTGRVMECRFLSAKRSSVLIRNLSWNYELVSEHAWGQLDSSTYCDMQDNGGRLFDFGDEIQFTADVMPYIHKDGTMHYGIQNLRNIIVLNKSEMPRGLTLERSFRFTIPMIRELEDTNREVDYDTLFACLNLPNHAYHLELRTGGYQSPTESELEAVWFDLYCDGELIMPRAAWYKTALRIENYPYFQFGDKYVVVLKQMSYIAQINMLVFNHRYYPELVEENEELQDCVGL